MCVSPLSIYVYLLVHDMIMCANWYKQGEWEAQGTDSSTPFTAIDLSEGEWYDYDEKAGDEVSIKEIGWEIKKI